jgi:hypothetical protein
VWLLAECQKDATDVRVLFADTCFASILAPGVFPTSAGTGDSSIDDGPITWLAHPLTQRHATPVP